jgi:transposase
VDGAAVLLPHGGQVRLERVRFTGVRVRVEAATVAPQARCSGCGIASMRVHSRYVRRLADCGIGGREVLVEFRVRRFFATSQGARRSRLSSRCPG